MGTGCWINSSFCPSLPLPLPSHCPHLAFSSPLPRGGLCPSPCAPPWGTRPAFLPSYALESWASFVPSVLLGLSSDAVGAMAF